MKIKWLERILRRRATSTEMELENVLSQLAAARCDIRMMLATVDRLELEKVALKQSKTACESEVARLHKERQSVYGMEEAIQAYKLDAENYKASYQSAMNHILLLKSKESRHGQV